MPRFGFLDAAVNKAQAAINTTPLNQYVPTKYQGTGPQGSQAASSGQGGGSPPPSSSGGMRSHALDALQHQFRSLQVQYGAPKDVRQLQLVITGQKGVVLDLDKECADTHSVSKEFYLWGQSDPASDIKDVTDRLAYLTYLHGSLAATLASALDAARAPLKALRDMEAQMQPRRNTRQGYELQISKLKNEGKPGTEGKVRELEGLLRNAEAQDEPLEREIELVKRKAIVESESMRWDAIREYGEKLVLVSQACKPLASALPSIPPTHAHPYTGATQTAAIRASLQKALDTYTPGTTTLPPPGKDATGADTRSFGETHANELSRIGSVADKHGPISVGHTPSPPHVSSSSPDTPPTPINPHTLNNAPAPIPISNPASPLDLHPSTTYPEPQPHSAVSASTTSISGTSVVSGHGSVPPPSAISPVAPGSLPSAPTVAETGVPLSAGSEGPGPASGSLAGGKEMSSSVGEGQGYGASTGGPGYGEAVPAYGGSGSDIKRFGLSERYVGSAEEEKSGLERQEREKLLAGGSGSTSMSTYESAEDEKRRLEREERERLLRGSSLASTSGTQGHSQSQRHGQQGGAGGDGPEEDGALPPPAYEEPQ